MSPMVILGILLAISVAGNAWQYHEHTKDAVKFGATKQLADDTTAAAVACSTGVDNLAKAGRTRQTELMAALKGVAPQVAKLQADALEAGRAKPDDPKDLCGSLERYLKGRIKADRAGVPSK